jgi:hypothetical protein
MGQVKKKMTMTSLLMRPYVACGGWERGRGVHEDILLKSTSCNRHECRVSAMSIKNELTWETTKRN